MKQVINFWLALDTSVKITLTISTSSIIFTAGLLLFFYNVLPAKLPLFYSLPWGQTQLVTKQQFLLLPLVLLLINLLNFTTASQLHHSQIVLKKLLVFGLILIDLIITMTATKILFIFI